VTPLPADGGRPSAGIAAAGAARAAVLRRIDAACRSVGRAPGEVTLVAVSKTVDPAALRDAVAAGLTVLGENRVQEAAHKVPDVPGASWHLIGPLQSNKVRRALEIFDVIESVDSVSLAQRLDRLAREVRGCGPTSRYPILLQVNVDGDPAKAGFAPADLPGVLVEIAALAALDVRGLMTIGQLVGDAEAARPTFHALRVTAERLRAGVGLPTGLGASAVLGPELSMGMTDDLEVAIQEGATIVRVGRALFGERVVGPVATGSATADGDGSPEPGC
jgi:pyridoxal phosphate enzyme (YggS family)